MIQVDQKETTCQVNIINTIDCNHNILPGLIMKFYWPGWIYVNIRDLDDDFEQAVEKNENKREYNYVLWYMVFLGDLLYITANVRHHNVSIDITGLRGLVWTT